MICSLQSSTDS